MMASQSESQAFISTLEAETRLQFYLKKVQAEALAKADASRGLQGNAGPQNLKYFIKLYAVLG